MYFFMDATVQATTGISSRRVAASRPKTRHSGSGRVWNPISLTAMRLVVSGGSQCPTKSAAHHRPPGRRIGSSTVAEAIRTALGTTIRPTSRLSGMATPSRSLRTAELGECTGSSLAPVPKIGLPLTCVSVLRQHRWWGAQGGTANNNRMMMIGWCGGCLSALREVNWDVKTQNLVACVPFAAFTALAQTRCQDCQIDSIAFFVRS